MESLVFVFLNLFLRLAFSGIYVPLSFAFPSKHDARTELVGEGRDSKYPFFEQQSAVVEKPDQVNTITVICHPDFMEIDIKADMFKVGFPVDGDELRLGVEHNDLCKAVASSHEDYSIIIGLSDCGTKHWMTKDLLIYTNLLIYDPMPSPDGLIRMEEAVIPIECDYERKYSLSSAALKPTWVPFTSTQAAVEALEFDLTIMTSDWQYERSSNVFYLGEPIAIEASVRVGHHVPLRVFLSSCVATLNTDIESTPRYVFIDNDGCLVDSQLQETNSQFLPRTQDEMLRLVINAFRFHNDDRGEIYITCHLNAVPVTSEPEPEHKACTFINGRWRSADSNDYLCAYCQNTNEAGKTHTHSSSYAAFGPRSYGSSQVPKTTWRSGPKADKAWEQVSSVGPVLVLPARRSEPFPPEDLPPLLSKIAKPSLYGSQWRSGVNKIGHVDGPMESSEDEEAFGEKDLEKGLVSTKMTVVQKVMPGFDHDAGPSSLGENEDLKDRGETGELKNRCINSSLTPLKSLTDEVAKEHQVVLDKNAPVSIDDESMQTSDMTLHKTDDVTEASGDDSSAAPQEENYSELETRTLRTTTDSGLSDKDAPKK
ncbi:zona pellucida sperm-binding protein 3-like [Lampris incognitus]|uniref:zona pellucida sperm-binding protein 3-like n=1 Tax=Lampris incognitus TaxID=2546036 RepID=UPI0024B60EA0|nr:zona pellucida sperm-binding protein 3-like [Lampris incognitus]